MGWTISVGRPGAKGGNQENQALALCIDVRGLRARVDVAPAAATARIDGATAVSAWQARRLWRNVLSTLVDIE